MLLLLIKAQSIHQSILTKNPIERGGVASSIQTPSSGLVLPRPALSCHLSFLTAPPTKNHFDLSLSRILGYTRQWQSFCCCSHDLTSDNSHTNLSTASECCRQADTPNVELPATFITTLCILGYLAISDLPRAITHGSHLPGRYVIDSGSPPRRQHLPSMITPPLAKLSLICWHDTTSKSS